MLLYNLSKVVLIISTFLLFFNVLLMILKVPSIRDKKKIKAVFGKKEEVGLSLEIARVFSKYVKLSDERKEGLKFKLASANISMSPELFIAKAIVRASIPFLLSVSTLILASYLEVTGIISILVVALIILFFLLSVVMYSSAMKKVDEIIKEKREAIEWELPRFLEAITTELTINKDLIKIFENYSKSAGKLFLEELEITIADMRMGNIEKALHKLDKRVGLASLSQVIRGLISVSSGEDNDFYFKMLSYELSQIRYQKLKKVALKRPAKIRRMNFIILASFLILYIVIFALELTDKLSIFK